MSILTSISKKELLIMIMIIDFCLFPFFSSSCLIFSDFQFSDSYILNGFFTDFY